MYILDVFISAILFLLSDAFLISVFQSFDDETRSIRAQTAALLKRIHEPLPRATKSFPISVPR
jgi:hypothetical protein